MFMPLITQRRSKRKFQNKEIEKSKIDILTEAALRSPSSRSLNPWEFIFITDKAILEELSQCKPHGASFLKNAPLGIVVLGNPETADTWIEDTSIASTFIQLTAESLNLGSCWIQIRMRMFDNNTSAGDKVREALNIPENINIESIIAVGYPDEEKPSHEKSSLQYDKIFKNKYGIR